MHFRKAAFIFLLILLAERQIKNQIHTTLADAKMSLKCRSFTLSEQLTPKYKEPGNHNSGEDMVRTCKFTYNKFTPIKLHLVVRNKTPHLPSSMCNEFIMNYMWRLR